MKKLIIFSLALAFSFQVFAQSTSGWKIGKIGVTVGKDLDMLPKISDDYFLKAARGLDAAMYQGLSLTDTDLVGAVCENPDFDLDIILLPPGMKNTELHVSLLAMINRVDGASYTTNDWGNTEVQHLNFGSTSSEVALESIFRKKLNVLKVFNFYGGVGTNLGVSFGGRINISGNNIPMNPDGNMLQVRGNGQDGGVVYPDNMTTEDYFFDSYQMKNALHQRVFAHAGIGIVFFKRIEIGIEGKYGVGYRFFGKDALTPSILNSVGLTARYIL